MEYDYSIVRRGTKTANAIELLQRAYAPGKVDDTEFQNLSYVFGDRSNVSAEIAEALEITSLGNPTAVCFNCGNEFLGNGMLVWTSLIYPEIRQLPNGDFIFKTAYGSRAGDLAFIPDDALDEDIEDLDYIFDQSLPVVEQCHVGVSLEKAFPEGNFMQMLSDGLITVYPPPVRKMIQAFALRDEDLKRMAKNYLSKMASYKDMKAGAEQTILEHMNKIVTEVIGEDHSVAMTGPYQAGIIDFAGTSDNRANIETMRVRLRFDRNAFIRFTELGPREQLEDAKIIQDSRLNLDGDVVMEMRIGSQDGPFSALYPKLEKLTSKPEFPKELTSTVDPSGLSRELVSLDWHDQILLVIKPSGDKTQDADEIALRRTYQMSEQLTPHMYNWLMMEDAFIWDEQALPPRHDVFEEQFPISAAPEQDYNRYFPGIMTPEAF